MTDLKPEDLAQAVERLTKASNTFPAHIGRDGVGMISVRQADVFLVLGELERLLADRARMEKALRDLAESMPFQVQATRGYLLQNGLDAHFADVLLSHYLDFAREAGEAVGASQ